MTKRSISLKSSVQPFLLKPVGKDYLWGGTRLNDDFSKNIDLSVVAESWECSTHTDGVSIVNSGEHEGQLLTDVLRSHPEYLGENTSNYFKERGELPILIKLIDAKKDLSVQVHPDDEFALREEHSLGKTEMWYVMDAVKGAKLTYGFQHEMTKELVRKSINDGNIEKYLRKVNVEKDDVFFIEAGMVHAIGAGNLIAEIQENSNITYRMYDYNRVDKNGNLRELHLDKALQVVNLHASANPRQPMRVLKYYYGYALELLCRCMYFQVERMLLNTERYRDMASICADSSSFEVLLCIEGCGSMILQNKQTLEIFKGDCIFVPAGSVETKIHGKAQFLKIRC